MNITWHGLSCIEIETRMGAGEDVKIIVDPYEPQGRFKVPRRQADIVAVTQIFSKLHNHTKEFGKDAFIVDVPGEFEIKGVLIRSVRLAKGYHMLSVSAEGLTVGCLTALASDLKESMLEQLGTLDILAIAVGDATRLTSSQAVQAVNTLEPRMVIPVHYQLPGWPIKLAGKEEFLKTLGLTVNEAPLSKLRITRRDIPAEEMRLVILEG